MTSEVEICNIALSNIRGGSINSFDDGTIQAQNCKLKYPILRDRLLSEASWGFNRKITALSLLDVDIFNWNYVYQYPADCLDINRLVGSWEELSNASQDVISRALDDSLLSLGDTVSKIPYEVFNNAGNKVIAANEPDLRVDYSLSVTDPNLFTGDFIMALSHLLSSELAIPVVGVEQGRQLRSDSLTIYNSYVNSAVTKNENERHSPQPMSEFETVRR